MMRWLDEWIFFGDFLESLTWESYDEYIENREAVSWIASPF